MNHEVNPPRMSFGSGMGQEVKQETSATNLCDRLRHQKGVGGLKSVCCYEQTSKLWWHGGQRGSLRHINLGSDPANSVPRNLKAVINMAICSLTSVNKFLCH